MDEVRVRMVKEKETKNKIRFAENSENPQIGVIYIPKETAKGCERIEVTVQPVSVKTENE